MKGNNAKYRLRDERGRFVSKLFSEQVTRALAAQKGVENFTGEGKGQRTKKLSEVKKEAHITPRELFTFYDTNKPVFLEMLRTGTVKGMSRNSNQIEKDLSNYKGKVFVNGKEVSATEAKLDVLKFKQFLSNTINVVDFTVKPKLSFSGEMFLDIPNPAKITRDLMRYFDVDSVDNLNEFTGAEITEALGEILEGDDYGIDEEDLVIYAS